MGYTSNAQLSFRGQNRGIPAWLGPSVHCIPHCLLVLGGCQFQGHPWLLDMTGMDTESTRRPSVVSYAATCWKGLAMPLHLL